MNRMLELCFGFFCLLWIGIPCKGTSSQFQGSVALYSILSTDLSVFIDGETDTVTITMSHFCARWLGVGFGSNVMNGTYAITNTIDIDAANVERKLGYEDEGTVLTPTITVESDTQSNCVQTTVVSRAITIDGDSDYFDFSTIGDGTTIDIIWALGPSDYWGDKHSYKGSTTITFTQVTAAPTFEPTESPTFQTGLLH